MPRRPQRAYTIEVLEWDEGREAARLDDLAAEEPLEIRVDGAPVAVTMRTPGDDAELAVGFLFTEGIIRGRDEIERVESGPASDNTTANVVDVVRRAGAAPLDLERLRRHGVAASSCGVCGKTSIDAIRARDIAAPSHSTTVDPELLCRLPDVIRPAQTVFARTGGLHAAALFTPDGALVAGREDIGRHNAVDKVIGRAVVDRGAPLSDLVLLVSGRGGFEIVQKALVAGVPIVAAVSVPSSLAVRLAREYGLTLVGFLRGARFVVYSGAERIAARAPVA